MNGRLAALIAVVFVALPSLALAAATYTFSTGFSTTQGANQWSYYQLQNSAYSLMTWDSAANVWRGVDGGFPFIGADGSLHPGNASDAVIRWTAPASGTLDVTGTVADTDGTCGDGITASIVKNGTMPWSATLENGDGVGKSPSITKNVSSGDTIDFILNRRSEYECDSTRWNPTITLTPQKTNDLPALQGLVTNAKNAGLSEVVLEPKTYRLECGEYCLLLDGISNMTVRGVAGQTKLLVATPTSGAIHWRNSQNIGMRDISIDYETPPFTQGAITSINGGTVVLQLDPGYPQLDDPLFVASPSNNINIAVALPAGSNFRKPVPGPGGFFADIQRGTLTSLGNNRWQFTSAAAPGLVVGDRLAVRANVGAHVVVFGHDTNISLNNVSMYAGPMLAFVFGGNSGTITLNNLTIKQSPGTNRLLSTGADGFHLQDNSADISLMNSWIQGMGDDGWNSYMIGVQVLSKIGLPANQIRVEGPARDIPLHSGDTIKIINAGKTAERFGGAVATVQTAEADGLGYKLTLDRSAQEIVQGDYVYSPRLAANVSITNTHFGPFVGMIRMRGGSVFANNYFEDKQNALIYHSMDGGYNEGPIWTAPCTSGNQVVGGALKLLGFGYSDEGNAPNSASCVPQAPQSCTFNGTSVASGQSVTAYQSSSVPFNQTCTSQSRTCTNGTLSGSYTNTSCSVAAAASCTFNGQAISSGSSITAYQSSSVLFGQQCVAQTRNCQNGTLSGAYAYGACSVGGAASCTLDGINVAHGSSQTFYSTRMVPFGSLCSAISQSRTCANGTLSGSASYQYGTCAPGAANSCSFNNQSVAHGASVTAYQSSAVPLGQQCTAQMRACQDGTLSGTYQYPACVAGTAASCTWNGQSVAHGANVIAYQISSVAFGSSCLSQTRSCTNGTLSGSYAYVSCSANAPTSCTFNGTSVASGASMTAYQSSSVPSGSQCVSQSRACSNGTLSGTYQYASCSVAGSSAVSAATSSPSDTSAMPAKGNTDVLAQIQSLLVQVRQLQALLAQLQAKDTGKSCVNLTHSIGFDETDARTDGDVTRLQRFLTDTGLYTGAVSGHVGPATVRAVQKWQSSHGIVSSGDPDSTGYGYVGPKTRGKMACTSR